MNEEIKPAYKRFFCFKCQKEIEEKDVIVYKYWTVCSKDCFLKLQEARIKNSGRIIK